MPRRRGRLRRRARRLHGADPRALRRLPGRQPRPGGARRARHLLLLRQRRRPRSSGRGSTPARRPWSSSPASSRRLRTSGVGLFHASPRDPIWEYVLSIDQAEAGLDAQEERIGLIGHSHISLFFTRPDGAQARRRATAPRPATGRCWTSRRRLAAQPRQRRPAARRRPPRRLAGARHRGVDGPLPPRLLRHRRAPPRRSSRPACRASSRSASAAAADAQMQANTTLPAVV